MSITFLSLTRDFVDSGWNSYLRVHVNYLLDHDPIFAVFFQSQPASIRNSYLEAWEGLDCASEELQGDLIKLHSEATFKSQRRFLLVQEHEFAHSMLPSNWLATVRNHELKKQLYTVASNAIETFVASLPVSVRFYGGLKSDTSIERKLVEGWTDSALFDLWDVVRFRVITPDLDLELKVALAIWEYFWSDIVRCRNYYYRPRQRRSIDGCGDAYRAIHFELRCDYGVYELQVMTQNREAVSLLDHRFVLKRSLPFINAEHEAWLRSISLTGNVLDVRDSLGPELWKATRSSHD